MNPLLRLAELPYRGINRLHRALYRRGLLVPQRLPRPVISIGNITAGGSGKTPAVIAIARHLEAAGLRVAILTRGYGRKGGGGAVDALDADRFGDEPVLIKKHVPNANVIVGSNRYQNGLRVSCDVYLLDDGFQHLRLARDLDIVIQPEGRRFQREGRGALADADIVLPRRIRPSGLESLRGRRVTAFAGLADNEQFFQMLRTAGVDVIATLPFPDHHRYSAADLARLRASGADVLVTTEKDAVKIADRGIIAVGIEFEIDPAVLARIETVARLKS